MNPTLARIARGLGRAAVALVAVAIIAVLVLLGAAIRLVTQTV